MRRTPPVGALDEGDDGGKACPCRDVRGQSARNTDELHVPRTRWAAADQSWVAMRTYPLLMMNQSNNLQNCVDEAPPGSPD